MTNDMTPRQRIAAGYAENDEGGKRHDERLASCYRHSEAYEKYVALRESDPDRFDRLPRTTRMAVGHYLEARDAAERTGRL